MLLILFWTILIVLKHPMLLFSCLITLFQEYLEKNMWKENFLWKKISPEKILFFLRYFSFSLSLCKFSFKMFLMKSSLYECMIQNTDLYWSLRNNPLWSEFLAITEEVISKQFKGKNIHQSCIKIIGSILQKHIYLILICNRKVNSLR